MCLVQSTRTPRLEALTDTDIPLGHYHSHCHAARSRSSHFGTVNRAHPGLCDTRAWTRVIGPKGLPVEGIKASCLFE